LISFAFSAAQQEFLPSHFLSLLVVGVLARYATCLVVEPKVDDNRAKVQGNAYQQGSQIEKNEATKQLRM